MRPKFLTREQVRRFDQFAIEQCEIPSLVLMENAARGATDVLEQIHHGPPGRALLVCGAGNNGGDGLVMARHLHIRGWQPVVILLADPEKISQDAATNLRILNHTAVKILTDPRPSAETLQAMAAAADWTIDAILGTGARPPLRPPLDQIIRILNTAATRRMAVDIPTGLECDTTVETDVDEEQVFKAELTATFVAAKPVMTTRSGKKCCGEIRILDIGAPPEVFQIVNP